jgi:hypothetical protein
MDQDHVQEVSMSMFSSDSSVSYGRISSFITLLCLLVWTCVLAYKKDEIPDVPANWFAIITAPYLISKAGETVQKVFGKGG